MEEGQDRQVEQLQKSLDDLTRRFDQLSARLEAVERHRLVSPPAQSEPDIQSPAISKPPRESREILWKPKSDAPSPAPSPASIQPQYNPDPTQSKPKSTRTDARIEAFKRLQKQPASKSQSFDIKKLEWLLGTRGLALAGMLIVVVGVGMFLKLAVDEGWIAAIPPAIRCGGAALFGVVLVGVGEFFRRRINPLASSGISATGIATMYGAILAAAKLYELINTPVAFILMVLVTITGVLLGSLSNRVMLAILSLLGAFAVPVLLSTGEPSYVVMPAYLMALLALGLALSGWRGGAYGRVRQIAWWGTGILGTLWLEQMHVLSPTSSLTFVSLVWLMTIAELIASSRFFTTLRERTKWPVDSHAGFLVGDNGEKTFDPRTLISREARWINSLFGVSAWAVTAAAMTLREIDPKLDFLASLSFSVVSILIVLFVLVGKRKKFSRFPDSIFAANGSPRSALAAAMIINSTLLGVATIATALGGWVQVVAWAMVGLAAIETAKQIRFRAVGLFGFAMLAVAIGRLLSLDLLVHLFENATLVGYGFAFTQWSAQVVFIAGVCAAAAWRSRYRTEANIIACVSLWLVAVSLVHYEIAADSLGAALLVLAAIGAWISYRVHIPALRINSYVLAGVGMGIVLLGQFALNLDAGTMSLDINVLSMIVVGLAWIVLAALPDARYKARCIFATFAVVSGTIAIAKLVDAYAEPEALFVVALYAGAVIYLGTRLVRWSLVEIGSVLLFWIACAWAVYQFSLGEQAFDGQPFVTLAFGSAIIVVGCTLWAGRLLPKLPMVRDAPYTLTATRAQLTAMSLGLAWMLLLSSTSIEIVRTMRLFFEQNSAGWAAVSIWWSLFAIASVALGFKFKSPPMRWGGLVLLGVVAIKVLLVDTVTLNQASRIVAAITVGLIIIAAGVLYAKLVEVVTENGDEPESESEPGSESAD